MLAHWNNSPQVETSSLTKPGLVPIIYHSRDENANHYVIDVITINYTMKVVK
jgi:hypothetical protein